MCGGMILIFLFKCTHHASPPFPFYYHERNALFTAKGWLRQKGDATEKVVNHMFGRLGVALKSGKRRLQANMGK